MGWSPRPVTCTLFLARLSIDDHPMPDLLRSSNRAGGPLRPSRLGDQIGNNYHEKPFQCRNLNLHEASQRSLLSDQIGPEVEASNRSTAAKRGNQRIYLARKLGLAVSGVRKARKITPQR